jgi:hypothetical protein
MVAERGDAPRTGDDLLHLHHIRQDSRASSLSRPRWSSLPAAPLAASLPARARHLTPGPTPGRPPRRVSQARSVRSGRLGRD